MNVTQLFAASKQWATRPDDQRFLSLEDLKTAVHERRQESWTLNTAVGQLRVQVTDGDGLAVEAYDAAQGYRRQLEPTNWAFGQLAQYAQAPAAYLRKLPTELTAINLQWGLEHGPIRADTLALAQSNGTNVLRSLTSTSYGRIWDEQVVDAVIGVNEDGRWKVPASSEATSNPKRATTLYASDRDVFVFLVDDSRPIDIGGKPFFRGFYAWNSEVGSLTFGLTTFLYERVCDNRIIWGATDVQELRIRHTGGAPERFRYEGAQLLRRYADEGTTSIVAPIQRAREFELPKDHNWAAWLQDRGFSANEAKNAVNFAEAEEGEARSLWDIIQGATASARSITHTDSRVRLETAAGKLLKYVQ